MEPGFEILTERLRLRPFQPEDLEGLYSILGDPETMRFYPKPYSLVQTAEWIADNIARYERDGFGLWAIDERASGGFLGDCGPAVRTVEGMHEVEIGWHVRRDRWGEGIATEAATACRDHCFFMELGLERVISLVRPENAASCRVAEKIGMAFENEIDWHDLRHRVYSVGAPGP